MFGPRSNEFDRHRNPFERNSRIFKKGDMKYVILSLLNEHPAHGYELTQTLEDRFYGLYSPSSGSVYPVLQLLEDMGYVTSYKIEGRKVYTISEEGKQFLKDQQETTEEIGNRIRSWLGGHNREYLRTARAIMNQSRDIARMVRKIIVSKDREKVIKLNEILGQTLKDIEKI